MTTPHKVYRFAVLTLSVLFFVGCDRATNSNARNTATSTPTNPSPAASQTAPKPSVTRLPVAEQTPSVDETVEEAFEPPFLNRDNPFAPPDTVRRPSRDREGDAVANLALMGFINVGEPKAVLMIDNLVESLAVGQTKSGVQVIAIDPPQVTLQRGRRRWVESLAETHDGPPQ